MDCCASAVVAVRYAVGVLSVEKDSAGTRVGGRLLSRDMRTANSRIVALPKMSFGNRGALKSLLHGLESSSFSSSVHRENASVEAASDLPLEGTVPGDGSRADLMREVIKRLAEEDLEEAAKKYNYEDELFSQIDFAQIDAFTDRPFTGNPAAVCYLPFIKNESWLQFVATEFNVPTAFVVKRRRNKKASVLEEVNRDQGSPLLEVDDTGKGLKAVKRNTTPFENEFDIRWFTPRVELELCGHATLAASHLLFSSGLVEGETATFHTKSGERLKARKVSGYEEYEEPPSKPQEDEQELNTERKPPSGKGVVEIDFPFQPVTKCNHVETQKVADTLGDVEVVWVGKSVLGDYLVELASIKEVEQMQPQLIKMVQLSCRGVIVTAHASPESKLDFVSRFFAPSIGVDEDPVTGSAHCSLGPYWAGKLGKNLLEAYQASQRGGKITVRVDEKAGRVYLQGGAVLVMAGTLLNTFG